MENRVICIDTSVLIDFYRKRDKSKTFLYRLYVKHSILAVTSVTVFEIYMGSTPQQNNYWDIFFQNKVVLPFGSDTAKLAVNIHKHLKTQNKLIDIPDLFIAACAIENKTILATLNLKHFQRIPELEIFDKDSIDR